MNKNSWKAIVLSSCFVLLSCTNSKPKGGATGDAFWDVNLPKLDKGLKAASTSKEAYEALSLVRKHLKLIGGSQDVNSDESYNLHRVGNVLLREMGEPVWFNSLDNNLPYQDYLDKNCKLQELKDPVRRGKRSKFWIDPTHSELDLKEGEVNYNICPLSLKASAKKTTSETARGEQLTHTMADFDLNIGQIIKQVEVIPETVKIPEACLSTKAFLQHFTSTEIKGFAGTYSTTYAHFTLVPKTNESDSTTPNTEVDPQVLEEQEIICTDVRKQLNAAQEKKYKDQDTYISEVTRLQMNKSENTVWRERNHNDNNSKEKHVASSETTYVITYIDSVDSNDEKFDVNSQEGREKVIYIRIAERYKSTKSKYSEDESRKDFRRRWGAEVRSGSANGPVMATVLVDVKQKAKAKRDETITINGEKVETVED